MTEFSVITDETEIGPIENLLDLRISTAHLDRASLAQILGNHDVAMGQFSTFLAVDFYNHDTKTTDVLFGDKPDYNTLFSFKNAVDDFYLKHLEKDTILVDLFLTPIKDKKQGKTVKIGSARLPLGKLLERDYSFQAQEIVHDMSKSGTKISVGRVFYRMRMRKDLNEAQKWMH